MSTGKYQHLFGPVLSRRLGRSLGVDIVPFKTCSYDCIYCELGRTTVLTAQREDFVPCDTVLAEIRHYLDTHPNPDFITLTGSGEPTLHAHLGGILSGIKSLTTVPLAVLTNGSLLWDGAVRDALSIADVVLPSLDAGDAGVFNQVNRPAAGISFEKMVTGLVTFRESFSNALWLEVLFVENVNSRDSDVRDMGHWIQQIQPDRVQVNTVVRPPAERNASPVSPERLNVLATALGPQSEVIADYPLANTDSCITPDAECIVDLVRRRPCSAQEIAAALGLRLSETLKTLERLSAQRIVAEQYLSGRTFFTGTCGDNGET